MHGNRRGRWSVAAAGCREHPRCRANSTPTISTVGTKRSVGCQAEGVSSLLCLKERGDGCATLRHSSCNGAHHASAATRAESNAAMAHVRKGAATGGAVSRDDRKSGCRSRSGGQGRLWRCFCHGRAPLPVLPSRLRLPRLARWSCVRVGTGVLPERRLPGPGHCKRRVSVCQGRSGAIAKAPGAVRAAGGSRRRASLRTGMRRPRPRSFPGPGPGRPSTGRSPRARRRGSGVRLPWCSSARSDARRMRRGW